MGNRRIRFPVTANTAFAIAGAAHGTPGSPMPPDFLVALHNVGFNLRTLIHAHHRKSIEVRLLQASVLEGQLLEKRRRRAENRAAFDLRRDNARVDVLAAVDRADHAMHPNLAVRHRNFGHMRGITPKSKVHRNPAPHPFRQRLIPSRFLCGEIEHAEMPRLFQQKLAPELVRIFLREAASSSTKHSIANAV